MDWSKVPRFKLATLPTPLQFMEKVTESLGGPNIYLKRDDETGLAFGGNKVRKLEFIIADALEKKADVIITSGGVQTNHGRLTMAAAVKAGIKPVLVVTNEEPDNYEGNLLLDSLLGAEIHFTSIDKSLSPEKAHEAGRIEGEKKVKELKEKFQKEGKQVYVVPRGGRSIQGTLGYFLASLEIYEQMISKQMKLDYIVTSVGSSSTLGGLILGNKMFNTGIKVIGISVSRNAEEIKDLILQQAQEFIDYFSLNISISREEICVFDSYVGDGYAIPTDAGLDAIKLFGSKESVFMDHIYTGKGMSGLLDLIGKEYFKMDENILFIHTGGGPALFSLDVNKLIERRGVLK